MIIIGIAETLTVLFVVLKLTGVIAWSWWLVLLPLIISFSIYALIIIIKLVVVIVSLIAIKIRN